MAEVTGEREFEAALTLMKARAERAMQQAHVRFLPVLAATNRPQHEVTRELGDSVVIDGPHHLGGGLYRSTFGPTAPHTRIIELGKKRPHSRGAKAWFLPGFKRATEEFDAVLYGEALSVGL